MAATRLLNKQQFGKTLAVAALAGSTAVAGAHIASIGEPPPITEMHERPETAEESTENIWEHHNRLYHW